MGHRSREIELSYNIGKIIPANDPEMIYYNDFKKLFGEDGNILVIGVKDSSLYKLDNFTKFKYLNDELANFNGVSNVLSITSLRRLERDKKEKKFNLDLILKEIPPTQTELDSVLKVATDQLFYSGQIINEDNGATLILVAIDSATLESEKRLALVDDIMMAGESFSETTGIKLHYSGLPLVRAVMAGKVRNELNMFLVLSILVTGLILLIFFRSFTAVIFPMIIIGIMVVWVMGTVAIFGYKITILTALLPPIVVVIGIPNCIYLLNKYHHEYGLHGNKALALSRIIRKIGIVTLITNFTTAIGFGVLISTNIIILREFGIVAFINIIATFFVSITLIPAIYSYLPGPSERQMKHLSLKPLDKLLTAIDLLVHRHRFRVILTTVVILVISLVGVYQVYSVSYMVDDIPESSRVKKDLSFFEDNFAGVMPLEFIVDMGKKKGVLNLKNLKKINEFESFISELEHVSKPVSVVNFVKASKQAYYNNNPKYYELPNNREKAFVLRYFQNENQQNDILNAFVDTTGQFMRISVKIADLGSTKLDSLVNQVIEPKKAEIFADTGIEVTATGTTLIFIKGNKFLIKNLRFSLMLAFVLIAIIMGTLFANVRMIMISMIPNIIPLIITAGIMGFFNVPLKPSTALIFSIAFGISVDDSIHFLAKYRQELYSNNFFVPVAVSKSIRETGPSMIYTSIVLFFGFVIFSFSEFGGTKALGFLTSTTLLIAMVTNLVLLPSLLLTFDDGKRKKGFHPLIEHYDEFYSEDEDEEIELELIKVHDKGDNKGESIT